jgi:hypothetical protein
LFLGVNFVYFFVFFQTLEYADARRIFLPIKSVLHALFFLSVFNFFVFEIGRTGWKRFWTISNAFGLSMCFVILIQFITRDPQVFSVFSGADFVSYIGVRPPGTFEWGYVTCFVLVYFVAGNTLLLINEFSIWRMLSLALLLLCVVLTQSKSGYVGVIFSTLISLYFAFKYRVAPRGKIVVALILVVSGVILAISIFIHKYGTENFLHILNFVNAILGSGDMDASTSTRLRQAIEAVNVGYNYWNTGLLGSYDFIIENAYLDYLYRYGIFGFLFYISLMLALLTYAVISSIEVATNNSSLEEKIVIVSSTASVFGLAIISMSGGIFDGYKSSFWVAIIIALLATSRYSHCDRSHQRD